MITEKARIVAIDEQEAVLESLRYSACETCKVKAGCGQKAINAMSRGRHHFIRLPADGLLKNRQVDDVVDLAIDEGSLLRGSLLLYIFPLFMMIAGGLITSRYLSAVLNPDLAGIIGAASGFVIAFLIIRLHAVISDHNLRYRPTVCQNTTQRQ